MKGHTSIICYPDFHLAGLRAALSLRNSHEFRPVELHENLADKGSIIEKMKPIEPLDRDFEPVTFIESKFEQLSVAALNCLVDRGDNFHVAGTLLNKCMELGVSQFVVLAVCRVDISADEVYELCLNGGAKLYPDSKKMPEDVHIFNELFLTSVIQLINGSGVPASIFVIPGSKQSNHESPLCTTSVEKFRVTLRHLTSLNFTEKQEMEINRNSLTRDDIAAQLYR